MYSTELGKYEYITTDKDLRLAVDASKTNQYIGLDTENSGGLDALDPNVKLLLVQFEAGGTAYVVDARVVNLDPLKEIFEDPKWVKIVQNGPYDWKMLYVKTGINVVNMFDTQIAEYLLHAGVVGRESLEHLSLKYLDHQLDKKVVETFFEHPYDEPFTRAQLDYAADDVLCLPGIKKRQQMYLNNFNLNATAEIEFNLIAPVAKMELNGIVLDADKWRVQLKAIDQKLFKLNADIRNILPDPPPPEVKPPRLKKDGTPYANTPKVKPPPVLNLDSWQQLAWALGEIGVDLEAMNKITRKGLTNNTTLAFALKYYKEEKKKKVLQDIISYRGYKQTQKTFGENLLSHIRDDGRIHARFDPNGTDSGRFSSSNPNLQNIQKKGKEGKALRSCFQPPPGSKFIVADYSQIELRIAAELSGDPFMLYVLSDPSGDIHRSTAAQMYGVPVEEVTSDLRRAAKTINFGIIYGMSAKTLAERIGCSMEEAEVHLAKYKSTYPLLMKWLDKVAKESIRAGYTKTVGGRRRWFPSLDKNNYATDREYKSMLAFLERVGKNHPIQGTSADMTKTSIIMVDRFLGTFQAKLVNTIHDEICIEVPERYVVPLAKLIKRTMILAAKQFLTKVPVDVDCKIRDAWWGGEVDDNELGQQLWLIPE